MPQHPGARREARPRELSPSLALLTLAVLAGAVLLTERLLRNVEAQGGPVERLSWWDAALSVTEHVQIVIAVLIPALLVHGRLRAGELGLRRVSWRTALAGTVAYSSYLIIAAVAFAVLGAPPARSSATALADSDTTGLLVAYALIACLLVPNTEELLFRGFLYAAFRRRLSPIPATLLAGGLFGALHGPPLGTMLDLALLGIALCVIYEQTGSLLPCIAVHAVHNAITYGSVISLTAPATAALTLAAALACLAFVLPLTNASKKLEILAGRPAGA